MRSYTARELERETGFSRRTIAYYVQMGLLPRVGRRGPKTRYPKLVRDRLLFIRRVREAEEAGRVAAMSLRALGVVFQSASPELVANVADGRLEVTADLLSEPSASAPPPGAAPMVRRAAHEEGMMVREAYAAPESAYQAVDAPHRRAPGIDEAELAELLVALAKAAGRRDVSPAAVETWFRIEIAPGIALSVRDVADEDAALLDTVGRKLRELMPDSFGD